MANLKDLVIEWCIRDIRTNPKDWKMDSYNLAHKDGTTVWIANGIWALRVVTKDFEIGGVNPYLIPSCLIPWRNKLWKAVSEFRKSRDNEAIMNWVRSR